MNWIKEDSIAPGKGFNMTIGAFYCRIFTENPNGDGEGTGQPWLCSVCFLTNPGGIPGEDAYFIEGGHNFEECELHIKKELSLQYFKLNSALWEKS